MYAVQPCLLCTLYQQLPLPSGMHPPPPTPRPAAAHLPCSEEFSQERLNKLRGVENHARIDAQLYHDFETDDAKQVCVCVRCFGLSTHVYVLRLGRLSRLGRCGGIWRI